jgi:hypothetical protein
VTVCAGPGCKIVIEDPRWNQRYHDAACRLAAWQERHPRTYSAGNCPHCGGPLRLAIEARPASRVGRVAVINGKSNGKRALVAGTSERA